MIHFSKVALSGFLLLLSAVAALAQTAPKVQWQTSVPELLGGQLGASAHLANATNGEFQAYATPLVGSSLLVRLTPNGQVKKVSSLPNSPDSYQSQQLIRTQDGGFVLGGIIKNMDAKDRPFLTKLDGDGNLVWTNADAPQPLTPAIPPTRYTETVLLERANYFLSFINLNYRIVSSAFRRHTTKSGQDLPFRSLSLDNTLAYAATTERVSDLCEAVDGGFMVAFSNGYYNLVRVTDTDTSFALPNYKFIQGGANYVSAVTPTETRDGYYVIATDSGRNRFELRRITPDGTIVWSTDLTFSASKLLTEPNGVVVGGSTASNRSILHKFNSTGKPIWQVDITDGILTSLIKTTDGGYALSTSTPRFIKLSPEQNVPTPPTGFFALTAPGYDCTTGALTLNTTAGNGTPIEYRIIGLRDWSTSNSFLVPAWQRTGTGFTLEARQSGQVVTLAFTTVCGTTTPPVTPPTPPTPPTGNFALQAPGYDCTTGQLTANATAGNGTPIEYRIIGLRDWSTSNSFLVPAWQRTATGFTIDARQSGQVISQAFTTACGTTTPPPSPLPSPIQTNPANQTLTANVFYLNPPFELSSGAYNVSDGRYRNFTITASGLPPGMTLAINTLMNFFSVSVSGRATTVGTYPVTITATDTSTPGSAAYVARFTITIVNGSSNSLTLGVPGFDCASGRLLLNSTGGDGTAIDYKVPGLRDWAASAEFTVPTFQRTGTQFTLYARQSGREVTATFTANCGTARLASPETAHAWSVAVLGNPVEEQVQLKLSGLAGQTVQLSLVDASGRTLNERQVVVQTEGQVESLSVSGPAGVRLLRAVSGGRQQTLKVLKK